MEISAAGIVAQFRKRFGIRGPTDLSLEENIIPVANIGDIDQPPYNSKRGMMGSSTAPAVAAQYAYIGIRWPLTAALGSALVIRRLYVSSSGALLHLGIFDDADIASALGAVAYSAVTGSWDQAVDCITVADRSFNQAQMGLVNSVVVPFITPNESMYIVPPAASVSTPIEGPWVLRRGAVLLIASRVLNTTLTVAAYGDEFVPE